MTYSTPANLPRREEVTVVGESASASSDADVSA